MTPREEKIDKLVKELVAVHESKLSLVVEYKKEPYFNGYEWRLMPKNPKAASVYVSDGVNLWIDNFYNVEMSFPKIWDEGLVELKNLLQAVIDGRVSGWYEGIRDAERGDAKYVLEFRVEPKPFNYNQNVFLTKQFKKRRDVKHDQYEKY